MSRLVCFAPLAPAATTGAQPSIAWFQGATMHGDCPTPLPLGQRRKQSAVQNPLRKFFHGQVLALFAIQVEEFVAGQQAELHIHGELPSLHPESDRKSTRGFLLPLPPLPP